MHTQRDVQFDPSSNGVGPALGGSVRESPLGNVASWDELINSLGSFAGPPTSVNTGNQFSPTSGFNPFNPNPYNIDNITQPSTDIYGNPLAGFVSSNTGPELFGLQPGQFNPFNANPFNIDNIVQPTAYNTMNAPYNIAAPWLNPNVNPFGSMFGGIGGGGYPGRGNR